MEFSRIYGRACLALIFGGLTCAPLKRPKLATVCLFRRSWIVHVDCAFFLRMFDALGQDVVCTIRFLAIPVTVGKMSEVVCVF